MENSKRQKAGVQVEDIGYHGGDPRSPACPGLFSKMQSLSPSLDGLAKRIQRFFHNQLVTQRRGKVGKVVGRQCSVHGVDLLVDGTAQFYHARP